MASTDSEAAAARDLAPRVDERKREGDGDGPSPKPQGAGRAAARPRFRPPKKRPIARIVMLVILLCIVGAVVGVRLRPKPVTTSSVVRGIAIDAVYATGTVEALDRVTVKSKIAGSVAELRVREGDVVKKGDLLAVIDSPTLKYELAKGKADQWATSQQAGNASPQLAALEAQAKATQAQLATAREDRDRLQKLVATGAATQSDLDRADNQVKMLDAQLASQDAQRKSMKIDLIAKASGSNAAVEELAAKLAEAEVRSPIDGVILTRSVEPGEVVTVNGALFKIGDVTKLLLECSVDEADIGRISIGKKAAVSLYAFPKQAFHGAVSEIMPDADRTKKSFLVKVKLDDAPKGMRSGMSAEVNLVVDEHPGALLAPAESIDATGNVWVVDGDGKANKRAVKTGVRDMLRVEILEGLAEGDRVVVIGADQLKDGASVKATYQAPNMNAVLPKSSTNGGSL